ncbi:hypothetical protein BaRGS_00040050 [Batillaria attramentaria]|uniref:Uncharacterized protein n=1 Tax=Batillaria attramentaria TaxID=370345 RepID=A0ABD0J2A7_9CAEN
MKKARFLMQDTGDSRPRCSGSKPCLFEEILSGHIHEKVNQERVQYDEALVRADRLLKQTRSLRSQVQHLREDYSGLEDQFHHLTGLHAKFNRAAQERLHYLDRESHLAGVIAYLMAQHKDKELLVPMCFSARDWWRLKVPDFGDPRDRRRKRRMMFRFLCS